MNAANQKSEAPAEKVLERGEWDLRASRIKIPDCQLLLMLHYEYARCYKPIIQGVAALRNQSQVEQATQGKILAFARYLAQWFPEFPNTPWLSIHSEDRKKRISEMGISETKVF